MNRSDGRKVWRKSPPVCVAGAIGLSLGVASAWPIYETSWLGIVALSAFVFAGILGLVRERFGLRTPVYLALAVVTFVVTLVPVARPQSFTQGLLAGLVDGLSAIVLGWKQLLTLSLPVGSYQSVLVPAYVVFFVSMLAVMRIGFMRPRLAGFAVVPMLMPLAFGTVFGSSAVSAPVDLGMMTLVAPREISLWVLGAVASALWILWVTGAERRAALRLGRQQAADSVTRTSSSRLLAGRGGRLFFGAVTVILAFGIAAVAVQTVDAGARAVPRDAVAPEIVVRKQSSPLSTYRAAKQDEAIDAPLFSVESASADGALPDRLRIAVLDEYHGVDFHVGSGEAGRFARLPSGKANADDPVVRVRIDDAYTAIWLPTAGLSEPPSFTGARRADLADALYVNQNTGTAIVVPDGSGLQGGDGFTSHMQRTSNTDVSKLPAQRSSLVDLETMPELDAWLKRQNQSATGEGLTELIERLRARGYLSHSVSPSESGADGVPAKWLTRLSESYGTSFKPSLGGHSQTRVESLFAELNSQEIAAGENADPAALVAGVGDDEQFAAAAALIARALGYESRVVVGVRLNESDVQGVPACEGQCTGENLAAWIEVRGADGNWAVIDVTPQLSMLPQLIEQGEQLPEFPTAAEQRDAHEVDPPIGTTDQNESDDSRTEEASNSWLWPIVQGIGLFAGGLACIAVPVLFLPFAKRFRARKRRAEAVPELRALGAWAELVDRERDAGFDIDERHTRPRIAAEIGHPAVIWAASQVDRAVFSSAGIDSETADWIWKAVETHTEERRENLSKRERLKEAFALHSLWPFGVNGPAARRSSQRKAG
ncbi:DUF3488 domain-containing protein [Leucobacter sp. 1207-22]|uniref:DUF3488 domain-containing protein n=1 Tax=Leucobacter sp. 1207-22 TaxID=2604456 RepID=UPI004063796D